MSVSPPNKKDQRTRERERADKSGASRTSLREVRIRWSRIIPKNAQPKAERNRSEETHPQSDMKQRKREEEEGATKKKRNRAVRAPREPNDHARESVKSRSLPTAYRDLTVTRQRRAQTRLARERERESHAVFFSFCKRTNLCEGQ